MARRPCLALAATLIAVQLVPPIAASREVVSFDLGWRFFLGDATGGPCTASFPLPLVDQYCSPRDFVNTPAGAGSAAACQQVACQLGAGGYQFCAGGAAACGSPRCEIGASRNCSNAQAGWTGGYQNASEPLPIWLPAAATLAFDDSAWPTIDIPHDMAITGQYNESDNKGEGYLPYKHGFYRKHFSLPAAWNVTTVELYVEGALSTSSFWLNGKVLLARNYAGYTPVVLRLDNVDGAPLVFGGGTNVLVAYVDGSLTTGWWYEGSGLIRHAFISSAFGQAHIVTHSIRSPAFVDSDYHARATPAEGVFADSAVVAPSCVIFNGAKSQTRTNVVFTLYSADGVTPVASGNVSNWALPNRTQQSIIPPLTVPNAELWSIARPYLYTLVTSVFIEGSTGPAVDGLNTSVGIRTVEWSPERGLKLNDQNVKVCSRGRCVE